MATEILDTPVGALRVSTDADELAIAEIIFLGRRRRARPGERRSTGSRLLARARRQLEEYLAGRRRSFDLPLAPEGTAFQVRVWRQLQRIPYGETISYGELARRIGQPTASRAVGAANGANPIPIVIPCHRVIGASGTLVGFGGGLDIKERLLELETPGLFAGVE